ncbi:MAG: hypothetical protein U5L96_02770 [Owenweeksia sp.]|nr:hypothetical protein [Owenweeksia sp.]
MNYISDKIPLIEKEYVSTLRFPAQEVLKDKESVSNRIAALHHATSLGNLDHHKVSILFEDSEGVKRVNTTIWAITEKRIILKNNRTIPINRIHSVRIA